MCWDLWVSGRRFDWISRKIGLWVQWKDDELHSGVWLQAVQITRVFYLKHGKVYKNDSLDCVVNFDLWSFWCESLNSVIFISAAAIITGLCVAIYFIIDDAIDKKVEACLTKHFYSEGVFAKLNMTDPSPKDPAKITYTREDCQSIVDEARRRTIVGIKAMTRVSDCVKQTFEAKFLDFVLLKSALEKQNRVADGSKVLAGILPMAKAACNENS